MKKEVILQDLNFKFNFGVIGDRTHLKDRFNNELLIGDIIEYQDDLGNICTDVVAITEDNRIISYRSEIQIYYLIFYSDDYIKKLDVSNNKNGSTYKKILKEFGLEIEKRNVRTKNAIYDQSILVENNIQLLNIDKKLFLLKERNELWQGKFMYQQVF